MKKEERSGKRGEVFSSSDRMRRQAGGMKLLGERERTGEAGRREGGSEGRTDRGEEGRKKARGGREGGRK